MVQWQWGLSQMKHSELRWNPELQEWLCVRCGLTSDHSNREDAETELESFECQPYPVNKPHLVILVEVGRIPIKAAAPLAKKYSLRPGMILAQHRSSTAD